MKDVYMRAPNGPVFSTAHPEYHPGCERLSQKAGKEARKEYAREELRKILKPGTTVYTVLRKVSASGMRREISVFVITKNGRESELRNLDCVAANAIGYSLGKAGIVANGCGMDMGFAIVHAIGCAVWPHGTRKPHGTRNGRPDTNGGYALKHAWL